MDVQKQSLVLLEQPMETFKKIQALLRAMVLVSDKDLIPAPFVDYVCKVYHSHSIPHVLCDCNAILTLAVFGRQQD